MLPRLFLSRRRTRDADEEFLAIRLYIRLSYAYFFDRGKIPCLWAHLRAVNLAERYPPSPELGHAWSTHAPVMALIPWIRRGEAFANKSLQIRQDLGDECGQGQSLHHLGVVLFTGARFDECINACRKSVRLLERTGDYWERNMAWWQCANAMYRKGDLAEAQSEAMRLYQATTEMGDDKVSGFSLELWSRATGGQLPADVLHRELLRERNDVQATAQVLLAEAVRLIRQSEFTKALDILGDARDVCRKVGMMNAWVSPILPWSAMCHRLLWEKSNAGNTHRTRKQLHAACRVARQAVSVARKFQTDLPHALREAGMLSAIRGSGRAARKYLEESLDVARRQSAKFELAQTYLAWGVVGSELNWPGSSQRISSAKETLGQLGAEFGLAYFAVPKDV
jgi:two-component system sensor kinase